MITTQPKSKILLIIIGILLIANIVLISFFLLDKPVTKRAMRGDKKAIITAFLQKEIGFSPLQLQQYDTLNAHYRSQLKAMFEVAGNDKENEFKKLGNDNFSDSSIFNTATTLAARQKEIEIIMFKHFKDIRILCNAAQQPKFDSLFYKMLNRRNEGRKK